MNKDDLPDDVVEKLPRPDSPGPGPTIGEQLGLGTHWVPQPASFDVVKLGGGPVPMVVLRFATSTGVAGIALDPDAVFALSKALRKQTSGLVVPDLRPGAKTR